ncbi:MAG TPA: Nre family DNA repair protein, partial [Candidatus Thermoplasmatota archaeon]|nr:Nre family DNA repair protein [Candidatus Thermoplasmatota archaeon]
DPALCVACKAARMLCGYDPCPLLQRVEHHLPKVAVRGRDLLGSSPPSLFVGRRGYPKVLVGPMLPPEHREDAAARALDDPRGWMDLQIPDVVGIRSSLLRTTHAVRVDAAAAPGDAMSDDPVLRLSQELAVAARPVDTEVRLARVPRFTSERVADFEMPHGPTAELEKAALVQNPRVERPVERVTQDTDMRAADGLVELYRGGTDRYHLERILSAGMLGLQRKRRLVPTRWAITATDDTVGEALRKEVLAHSSVDKPEYRYAERFGNRFHVLLLPGPWGLDLAEAWMGGFWARGTWQVEEDFEGPAGRTTYAATAGGYYATKVSVLEHLAERRRQATALVVREVTPAYTTPLGVWVVRETTRLAMQQRPLVFEDVEAALAHMDRHAQLKPWRVHMRLLRAMRTQTRLDAFGSA